MKAKKFCYLEPNFPQNAFLCVAHWQHESKKSSPYFLTRIHTSFAEIRKEMELISQELSQNKGWNMSDLAGLIPLNFIRLFPLKEDYWSKPEFEYNLMDRTENLLKAMDNPYLYYLLVTPAKYFSRQKIWIFTGALSFLKNSPSKILENFMYKSNWPVEIKAKSAAIYEIDNFILYDWRNDQKIFQEQIEKIKKANSKA